MTDSYLICNFNKCRKSLAVAAWVTSCSHVFCDEHYNRLGAPLNEFKCPACNTTFHASYDIVKVDLKPSEEFKSMVLAGLTPEIVLDIARRAIAFWSYQLTQEQVYQTMTANHAKSKLLDLETKMETSIVQMKNNLLLEMKKNEAHVRDLETHTRKVVALEEQLNETNQQLRNIQLKYDSLRRQSLLTGTQDQHGNEPFQPIMLNRSSQPFQLWDNPAISAATAQRAVPQFGFSFKPQTSSNTEKTFNIEGPNQLF